LRDDDDDDKPSESGRNLIRKWLFAGLLVWIPLGGTLLVVRFLLNLLDYSLLLIPESLRPAIAIPGLGLFLSIGLVLGTGALTANYLGHQFLGWLEALLLRVPLVRSLYGGMKKLTENLFSENSSAFRKVVLIEWPRKGLWTIGFQSGFPVNEVQRRTGQDLVTVFVPTTPNPTAGFIMLAPRSEVIVLDMSVEEGMRYIISLGMVAPGQTSMAPELIAGLPPPPI
jgi:uncharacterized membrane protein